MADEQEQRDFEQEPEQEQTGETVEEVSIDEVIIRLADMIIDTYSPQALQKLYIEQPVLAQPEMLELLTTFGQDFSEDGDEEDRERRKILGKMLFFRLEQLRLLQRQTTPALPASENVMTPQIAARASMEVHAESQGIGVGSVQGDINQNNTTINVSLEKEWQQPPRPKLEKTFIGRQRELQELSGQLLAGQNVAITGQSSSAVTVRGMAGIGKTYLATRLAQQVYDRFGGNVITLRVGPETRTRAEALSLLNSLAAYTFKGEKPPGKLDPEIVRAWLEEMVDSRPLLVVLDDVWSVEVIQLLNGALPTHTVLLVTTRKETVVNALDGYRCSLDRLSPEDGLKLLQSRLHLNDAGEYRELLTRIVSLLGGHALALDIMAGLIRKPTHIQRVLSRLESFDDSDLLQMLRLADGDIGDDTRDTNLELSFALSYTQMKPEQQRYFRALGAFAPETPIAVTAAASVWEMSDDRQAQSMLDELEKLALLTEEYNDPDAYYTQHSLLHSYAVALLRREEEWERVNWLHACYYNELLDQTPNTEYPALDSSLINIERALDWSRDYEPGVFLRLTNVARQFLDIRGHIEVLEKSFPFAISVAIALHDMWRRANVLVSLGELESRLGEVDEARKRYEEALPLYREQRDRLGEANVLLSIADLSLSLQAWQEARQQYEQALGLYLELRDPLGQAYVYVDLGRVCFVLGDAELALEHEQKAMELFSSQRDEAWALNAQFNLVAMYTLMVLLNQGEQLEILSQLQVEALLVACTTTEELFQCVTQHPFIITDDGLQSVQVVIADSADEAVKKQLRALLPWLQRVHAKVAWYGPFASKEGKQSE